MRCESITTVGTMTVRCQRKAPHAKYCGYREQLPNGVIVAIRWLKYRRQQSQHCSACREHGHNQRACPQRFASQTSLASGA